MRPIVHGHVVASAGAKAPVWQLLRLDARQQVSTITGYALAEPPRLLDAAVATATSGRAPGCLWLGLAAPGAVAAPDVPRAAK
jgi:hypothetical protein